MKEWEFGATIFTAVIILVTTAITLWKFWNRKDIKRRLGVFLQDGDRIRVKCSNTTEPSPNIEADEWAEQVGKYLVKHLGEDYYARFYNSDGLPMGLTILSGEHAITESFVRFRIARLQQFLSELNR